ncbi:MAG: L,D-transpeptidase family protein [Blastocatellia bacterium]
MKMMARSITILLFLIIITAAAGCDAVPNNANTNTTANANISNANRATAATTDNAKAGNLTITLPLLDALFAEETFANDLKSRLQLNDDQVNRLRTIAREATAKLRESNDGDSRQGTATVARRQAEDNINAAIGAEKAKQLSAFVGERYKAEAVAPAPTTAGAIPSDTRIVVNAPAFRMDLFDNGKLIKSYRIAIGYPEFPLPSGMRKAESIIFNPTWTPPDEPWVEAPGSKVKVGETVKAGDRLNPLGPLKIPIGLPSLIHGGKNPARLGGFGSHGCVGLTNPQAQEFAKLLAQVGGASIDDAQIAEYEKNKTETKNVKLAKAVPVDLRYETIMIEDGKLHIYRDVYDQDTNTEENLRAVLQANGATFEQLSDQERSQALNGLKDMSRDVVEESKGKGANANSKTKPEATTGKITRTIKGSKEVVIEIAALKGKGYPAPVNLNTGSPVKEPAKGTKKK